MPLTIGHHSFTSQDKCIKFIQQALKDTGITQSLRNTNPSLYSFLVSLFQRHPNKDAKLAGMCDIAIHMNAFCKNAYTLYIITDKGENRDISWRVCVSGKKKPDTQLLRNALRYAVQPQIDEFKHSVIDKSMCEHCKCQLKSAPHIHHKDIEFEDIVREFLHKTKHQVPSEFDEDPVTHLRLFLKDDSQIAQEWIEYHKNRACLQYVCQTCNLSTLKT
jgi:hypothetical protein